MAGASCSGNPHDPDGRHPQRHPPKRFREDSGGAERHLSDSNVTLNTNAGSSERSLNFFQIET
jgi:hypothetical protein